MPTDRPRALSESLVIRDLDGETLIYDLRRKTAHCLAPVAGAIWRRCDGRSTVAELERAMALEAGMAGSAAEVVKQALAELAGAGLLVQHRSRSSITRRKALLGVLVPLVATIVVPSAQAAGSPCSAISEGTCCSSGRICKAHGPNFRCDGPICTPAVGGFQSGPAGDEEPPTRACTTEFQEDQPFRTPCEDPQR